jgi:WD40 repeat protein
MDPKWSGVTATLENHGTSTPFETLAMFSPDGSMMLTAGLAEGRLQLWKAPTEVARGFELRQFVPKEKRPATCAAFSPHPKSAKHNVAVTGNTDGDIYLWELPTPEQVATHRIENVPVRLLSHALDPNTHLARIAVDLPNPASPEFPNGRLIPGRAVTIVIGEE